MMIFARPTLGVAVVVGAGMIGQRKTRTLLDSGFAVRWVDPAFLHAPSGFEGVEVVTAPFDPLHLHGAGLVFACTNDRKVNQHIGDVARSLKLPVLVADSPEESTFFSVATLKHPEAWIGISTGGQDPSKAKQLKVHLETWLAKVKSEFLT